MWLPRLGASLTTDRLVNDRNRFISGSVAAGLDFGLVVADVIRGEEWTKTIQLVLEYAPAPPFEGGTVKRAGPEVTRLVADMLQSGLQPLDHAVRAAATRLKL